LAKSLDMAPLAVSSQFPKRAASTDTWHTPRIEAAILNLEQACPLKQRL
jgi:hypothetical protein